jgi:hypothetical protein
MPFFCIDRGFRKNACLEERQGARAAAEQVANCLRERALEARVPIAFSNLKQFAGKHSQCHRLKVTVLGACPFFNTSFEKC